MILLAVMFGNMIHCQLAILRCMYVRIDIDVVRVRLRRVATRRVLTDRT